MAYKFKVGQVVKFIDCEENKYSPPHGSIGTVLKVGAIGVDYLVECDGKLFWHITSHGEVKICEEVEGAVVKT